MDLGLTGLVLILVSGLLWGATDAIIKTLTPPQLKHNKGGLAGIAADFFALLCCPGYIVCQALNQLGSVLYYYTLSIAPISIVSPAVNTTKIVFNLIVGRLFCGEILTGRKLAGIILLTTGVILQIYPRD